MKRKLHLAMALTGNTKVNKYLASLHVSNSGSDCGCDRGCCDCDKIVIL